MRSVLISNISNESKNGVSFENPKLRTSKSGYLLLRRFPTFPVNIQSSSSEFSRTMVRRALRIVLRLVFGSSFGGSSLAFAGF